MSEELKLILKYCHISFQIQNVRYNYVLFWYTNIIVNNY